MNVAVIGGGPAGMIAAAEAARGGHRVTLLERNEKLGKKLYITGKGRCNVTNDCDRDAFFPHVLRNPRFLYSAWAALDARALMARLEALGVPLKTERGGRVFPVSDKSSDILRAVERDVRISGVDVRLNARVTGIEARDGRVTAVAMEDGALPCDAAILCTGGRSYPQTGSTGDGYRFAEALGHSVTEIHASLVPLTTAEDWPKELSGVTLKNVRLTAYAEGKKFFSEIGELLFTHFGVSGPLVLSLSGRVAAHPAGTRVEIDFKPGMEAEELDARLVRDLAAGARGQVGTALHALLPARLLESVLLLADVPPRTPVGELNKKMRRRLMETLKAAPLTITGARPLDEAVITRGGVNVREVDASTMRSKLVRGLYFAGEVLDVDATTGGYNLQIAWMTGYLAGQLAGMEG